MKAFVSFRQLPLILMTTIAYLNGISTTVFTDVQWTTAIKLSEYVGYKSVTLLSFKIPEQTILSTLSFQGQTSEKGCSFKEVFVYFQHGSYPVINPYNETFPGKFYTKRTSLHQMVIRNNDDPSIYPMSVPRPGTWYISAFIPKSTKDKEIKPPNMKGSCLYGMFVTVESQGVEAVTEMAFGSPHSVKLGNTPSTKQVLYRYSIPVGVVAYSLSVMDCMVTYSNKTKVPAHNCPVTISIQSEVMPTANSSSINCNMTDKCHMDVFSPILKKWTYLAVVVEQIENVTDVSLELSFSVKNCVVYQSIFIPRVGLTSSPDDPTYNVTHDSCVMIDDLGRFALKEFDFNVTFALSDRAIFPKPEPFNTLFVPDVTTIVTHFHVDAYEDIGGTLKVSIAALNPTVMNINQTALIYMCLMKYRIPGSENVLTCSDGIPLKINVTGEPIDSVYIPYPEPGEWFLGLYSQCFNKQTGVLTRCSHHGPQVAFEVTLSSCVDSQCGEFGVCREYFSGVHVFSTCTCIAGWRGYGCSDGSEAVPYSTELTGVLLLTLSNLFFIPSIILACYRRFFVEAIVYFFTMFFSLFYHACDTSDWLQYCMMKYEILSFSDFLGSILSFWMTLLAMAEISPGLRSIGHVVGFLGIAIGVEYRRNGVWAFAAPAGLGLIIMIVSWDEILSFSDFLGSILSFWMTLLAMAEISPGLRSIGHIVGFLGIAIGVEYRRNGVWAFAAPAGLGLIIMIVSWIRQCKLRHQVFPTKKRYLTNLLPGIALAAAGLIMFAFFETDSNYKYVHSAWHVVISTSIVFLLPQRRKTKDPVLNTDTADLLGGNEMENEDGLPRPTNSHRETENLIL